MLELRRWCAQRCSFVRRTMANRRRDEFTTATKRKLAERVAWRCSYPGCGVGTVGPQSHDEGKSINNGVAAHIHGAAPQAPRYTSEMTTEERRHISNGIWMCRDHGNLIDADFEEYSPDTLRAWKKAAERRAAESLRFPGSEDFPDGSTLLQLGSRNIYHAAWKSIANRKWSFLLIRPELGSLERLRDYVASLDPPNDNEAFVVVESQGDARRVNGVSLHLSRSGDHILEVDVQGRVAPTDPNEVGSDFKVGDDGDVVIEGGDFVLVNGIDAAKQFMMLTIGVVKGQLPWAREVGSHASLYYAKYRGNLPLLSRLLKMEMIRLSLIPVSDAFAGEGPRPSLDFVRRFLSVTVTSAELANGMLGVSVSLEWGNGEYWSGNVPVYVSQADDREEKDNVR